MFLCFCYFVLCFWNPFRKQSDDDISFENNKKKHTGTSTPAAAGVYDADDYFHYSSNFYYESTPEITYTNAFETPNAFTESNKFDEIEDIDQPARPQEYFTLTEEPQYTPSIPSHPDDL